MNAKTLAVAAIFAALTIALNLSSFKVPAPYAPFLYYQIWEIPLVAAFFLYGPMMATFVSIINTAILLVYFQGALLTGPLYNLAAVLSMLLGIYFALAIVSRLKAQRKDIILLVFSTSLGIFLRVIAMSILNWSLLRYPPPIGFEIPELVLLGMLPPIGFFNATLALYTIPVGFILARAVTNATKNKMWSPSSRPDQISSAKNVEKNS